MGSEQGPVLRRKCEGLNYREADALFFPGPGGKPHKANAYCSDCPLVSACLTEAIENNLQGFFAGTTEQDRRRMAFLHKMVITPLTEFMPEEPDRDKRVVYLKVFSPEDPRKWMDEDLEPSPEELLIEELVAAV